MALLVLVAVVISSGCTTTPVKAEEKTQKEIADVLAIGEVRTLPSSPVYTGKNFKLYITVKNLDGEKTVNGVNVEIFDPSVFRAASGSKYVGDILPMGEKMVDFDIIAPDSDFIADVETEGTINFRVTYDFESVATYDVLVVSENEIEKQMKAGTSVYLLSNKIIGSGPVRIYPELTGSEKGYMLAGGAALIGITLKNEGSGILQNNRIETGRLSIDFPPELDVAAPEFPTYTGNFIATGMATYTCPDGKTIYYGDICGYDVDASCCCADCSAYKQGTWNMYGSFGSRSECTSSCVSLCSREGTVKSWACCGCTGSCYGNGGSICPQGDSDCYCQVEPKTGTTGKTSTTTTSSTTIPVHVKPPSETIKKYFTCNPYYKCSNSINPIELVGKESVPFRFDVLDISNPPVDVYRTYTCYMRVSYTYELRGSAKVKVKPPEVQ